MASSRGWWRAGLALIVGLSLWLLIAGDSETLPQPLFTSLAVLPFEPTLKDGEQAHLATGLSLDLSHRLQTLGSLQLTARRQVLVWQDGDTPLRVLARLLGAEILVLGGVSQSSGRVLLSLEIVDARDGRQIAAIEIAESQERIFDLQRRAAIQVVDALKGPVARSARARLRRDPTRSLMAWDYCVQAQDYLEDLVHPRAPTFAADLFRRAIQHDPDIQILRQAAAAYAIIGQLPASERVYRQGLELDPLDPRLHQGLGDVLARQDRPELAEGVPPSP